MHSDWFIQQTAEPWVPEAPDDDRPIAEEVECFCGTLWYPDNETHCPSCGREESEIYLSDEQLIE